MKWLQSNKVMSFGVIFWPVAIPGEFMIQQTALPAMQIFLAYVGTFVFEPLYGHFSVWKEWCGVIVI